MAKGVVTRFMGYVDQEGEDGCWRWTGYKKRGYGALKMFGRFWLAHRLSYELFNGSIPGGKMVCHRCDQPDCVNPGHLFLGVAMDNMQDKIAKGRHRGARSGSRHHFAKLTDWQVEEIRALIGVCTNREIARSYGVSEAMISNIKTGKRWSNT